MPLLTRWFIRSAFFYLVIALILRLTQSIASLGQGSTVINALGPVYFHLFMVGWATLLIFGIVYWMFPKYSNQHPRRSESLGWATYWLLNAGLILRMIAEPLNSLQPGNFWGWLLVISALAQWLGGMAFVVNSWTRVKTR